MNSQSRDEGTIFTANKESKENSTGKCENSSRYGKLKEVVTKGEALLMVDANNITNLLTSTVHRVPGARNSSTIALNASPGAAVGEIVF